MSQSSENNLLRFGCPACGVRLVVDQSIAGTEGPCPSCGARIVAPPVEVSRTLSEKQAAPVVIKPRGVPTGAISDELETWSAVEKEEAPRSGPVPVKKPARRTRSVNPTTALSGKHQEKKTLKAFIKMALAVAIVACIVLAVCLFFGNA